MVYTGIDWNQAPLIGGKNGGKLAQAAPRSCSNRSCSKKPDLEPVQASRVRPAASMKAFFARRRARGMQPHPFGTQWDDFVLELFVGAARGDSFKELDARWRQSRARSSDDPDPWPIGQHAGFPVGNFDAPMMGINKGHYRAGPVAEDAKALDSCGYDDILSCQFGRYYETVQDVAAAGGSVIRQFNNCDLVWVWLFNESENGAVEPAPIPIPDPSEIYRMFTEDADTYLARFELMLAACVALGTRVIPTLFTLDGGSDVNNRQTEGDGGTSINDDVASGATYTQVRAVSPYGGVIIPSEQGWSTVYYQEDEIGYSPTAGTSIDGEPFNAEDRGYYAQFCLNVLSHDDLDPTPDDYQRESARRKALAVAAFGAAIGQYLAQYDEDLATDGRSITDYVPYLELGNEMSAHWLKGAPATGGDIDEYDVMRFQDGALELGRFMVLLAGPVWMACPKMRFSAPGVASWGQEDELIWEYRVEWIGQAITDGIANSITLISEVQEGLALVDGDPTAYTGWAEAHVEAAAWIATSQAMDFTIWPPAGGSTLSHQDMVHHANMHWFHPNDRSGARDDDGRAEVISIADGGYPGEARLVRDIEAFKTGLLVNTLKESNTELSITWALHPAGFPAASPDDPRDPRDDASDADLGTEWSHLASPLFQAGKVSRLLLTGRANGAEIVSWHTHMAGIVNPAAVDAQGWLLYSSMGLRNDLTFDGGDPSDFWSRQDAIRRPSWYAYRRLAAMLAQTDDISMTSDSDGLFVVRLSSSSGFGTMPEYALAPVRTYRYAYIAWLDTISTRTSSSFAIPLVDTWTRLSLAPFVEWTRPATPASSGYPRGGTPAWDWDMVSYDWTSVADAVLEPMGLVAYDMLTVNVQRSGESAPVPVCILANPSPLAVVDWLDPVIGVTAMSSMGVLFKVDLVNALLDQASLPPAIDWARAPLSGKGSPGWLATGRRPPLRSVLRSLLRGEQ